MSWYYVSFANTKRFCGAAVFEAASQEAKIAWLQAHCPISEDDLELVQAAVLSFPPAMLPAEEYRNRILSRAELESLWPCGSMRDLEMAQKAREAGNVGNA